MRLMRLRFLGTAAAEGYPDAFCDCAHCEEARALGGRSLRRRSAALVDGELLIDFGPDLMAAALMDGFSLAKVRYCVQTHEHSDHLDPSHFFSRAPACDVHGPRLHYFATAGALRTAAAKLGLSAGKSLTDPDQAEYYNLAAHIIEPFQPFDAGPYRVHPVRAAHDPKNIVALLHLIERDGRCLFYATDTGEIPEETWAYLAGWGRGGGRIHVVAMDHTWGLNERVEGHMNWEQFTEQIARLRAQGLLADGARAFAHHIAHHGNPTHEELVAFAARHGYEVAYDGLEVEV
jgi:phosphoribosyl 1,2-cyclic phosphate phosphodiesterase